jgi:hypothetical protein
MDGERRALIVAVDEYDHNGLRHLVAPAADAQALAAVLSDQQIGDFQVQVVRNEPAHVVEAKVEDLFSDGRPDDVLLLHFSCHGLKSESGELFFAARNTRPNRLGSTAIPADFVQRCMRTSRSRSIVLLLDCCYGGAFGKGVTVRASGDVNVLDSFPGGRLGGGRGRAVITASSAMEYAFEDGRLTDDHSQQPSVFTAALVEGLATGDADRDEDGRVSLNELYDYVFDKVREQTPHQTPTRDIEMQGELYLAHSRRRRIRPAPLPSDLRAAMSDSNMFTRIGAVSELRMRLASDNLPAALGAYEALAEIARTDIHYVADAAAAGLREAAIQAMERELDFGQVVKDSASPHRTIHVLGPPLARTYKFQASDNWIRVRETSGGLDVSVDTSRVGWQRGEITLTCPTGETLITVQVEIKSGPMQPGLPSVQRADTGPPMPAPVPTPHLGRRQPPDRVRVPASPLPRDPVAESPVTSRPSATGTAATTSRQGPPERNALAPPKEPPPNRPKISSRRQQTTAVAQPGPTTTPAKGAADTPTAQPTRPREGVDRHRPPPARNNRNLLIPGALAIISAVLMVTAKFAGHGSLGDKDGWSTSLVIIAGMALIAGICIAVPPTRPLIGPGLLLGTTAASTWALLSLVRHSIGNSGSDLRTGFWLGIVANALLVIASGIAALTVGGSGNIRLASRSPRGALAWVITLLGAAGAAALLSIPVAHDSLGRHWITYTWISGMALVVPTAAVLALPRRFGVALLLGWIGGSAAIFNYYVRSEPRPSVAFACTLFLLLIVIVPFARASHPPTLKPARSD